MANVEKLIKAFESLKVLQPDANNSEDLAATSKNKKEVIINKKDKTTNCNIIADCIGSATLRNAPDFPKFLGVAIETFLVLCDDAESDVRIVADECLNKTIKTLIESNLGRLQVELYKEVKKNGSSRSLRAALWRFADLCHLIRPQKCRPYVVNLLPCLSRICRRPEESVQETLSSAMYKICPVLIGFTTDIEAKMLLKSFLPNIRSPSVTMRRTAALSLTLICQHSRKPATFSVWLLNVLLDSVVPLEEMTDISTILGMLLALRHLLSHLMSKWQSHDSGQQMKGSFGAKFSESDAKLDVRQLVKVLELLLFYTTHSDHNVVTAALEALHQLLRNAPHHLLQVLVTCGGVAKVSIQEKPEPAVRSSNGHSRLPSVGEEASGVDDDVEPTSESVSTSESEDALQILSAEGDALPGDYVEESFELASAADPVDDGAKAELATDSLDRRVMTLTTDGDYSAVAISHTKDGALSQSSSNDTLSSVAQLPSPDHSLSSLFIVSDQPSCTSDPTVATRAASVAGLPLANAAVVMDTMPAAGEGVAAEGGAANGSWLVRDGDFGDLNDTFEVPLVYLVRLLCKQFLLTGYQYGLVSDRRVRVSVKALALSCVSYILELYPKAFLAKLHRSSPEPGELQDLRDVLRYVSHSDPQLKGNTAIVIGHLLRAVLTEGRRSFDKWVQSSGLTRNGCVLSDLVTPLISILEDENSVAARCALTSLQLCLPSLLNSNHSDVGLSIILALLQLKDNSYWLVKVELLELLSLIDYKTVFYLESSCTPLKKDTHHPYLRNLEIQDHVLTDVVLVLLGDEDFRVRHASAVALCRMIPRLFFGIDNPLQDPVAAKAKECTMVLLHTVMDDWAAKATALSSHASTVKPFDQIPTNPTLLADYMSTTTESALSRVVSMVVRHLIQSVCRQVTLGCCHALCLLSDQFPVAQYANAWGCCPFASVGLLSSLSSSLSSSSGGTLQNKKIFRSLSSSGTGSLTSSIGSILSPLGGGGGGLDDLSMATGGGGSLPLFLSILTSSPVALDLSAQADALVFVGNLFAGAAYKCLRCPPDGSSQNAEDMRWSALADRWLVPVADQLLTHVARLLNICFHVIEERVPGPPQSKPSLPSLPTAPSLSPIKRKAKSMKEDVSGAGTAAQTTEKTGSAAAAAAGKKMGPGRDASKEAEKEKGRKEGGLGVFYSHQFYVKLYEVLRGAYSNYKISLDLMNSEKFVHVLNVILQVLSQILEVASLADIGKYAEELLSYLRSTITVEATASVLCVQQLLKAIFGTNVSGQWDSPDQNTSRLFSKNRPSRTSTRVAVSLKHGIYHSCLNSPYTQFTQSLAGATFRANVHGSDQEEAVGFISWLKKKAEKKASGVMKLSGKTDKTSVASYIRLFEPLVIKALKQYTITSQVSLQQQVLDLLAHLVQLRVNYCLLDSDQIFIGYVIKQIEYIEEGQIRNSDQLISHMFNFLILLSYERYHSKTIITMPKIIQLCDGIMASGLDPTTHVIPSLQSIVNDLFIVRAMNKSDAGKDLETQREVVISMLLRLLQHYQMLELFIVILHQCRKEGEDRWKRLSRQVTDLILPLLAKQQVNLDSQVALDILHRLFENVAPSVFRPVDILLKVLLAKPEDLSTMQGLQRWVGLVLVTLRVVMAQSKEEVVLGRLQELGLTMSIYKDTIREHRQYASTELVNHFSRSSEISEESSAATCGAEETVARFLLQVVGVVVSEMKTHSATMVTAKVSSDFLSQELAHLLLYITHMFQSGIYRRVAMVAMAMIRRDADELYFSIQEINESFRSISSQHPTLMLQWSNVLILLNYDDQAWWSRVLRTPRTYMVASSTTSSVTTSERLTEHEERLHRHYTGACKSINREIVRSGGLILLCDYVCENLTDAEHMTWIIINHVYDLIRLSLEPPVQDFISAIHRNSAASGLFIQAIHSRCDHLSQLSPSVVKKMLKCLEAIHFSQTGALLSLLIEKFLNTHHLAVARICDAIACRRVEMLLAENQQDNVNQMTSGDLEKVVQFMKANSLMRRHCRLATLLGKLQDVVSRDQPPALMLTSTSHPSTLTTVNFTNFHLSKDWFLSFVQEQCFGERAIAKDCAQFLQHLDYTSILNIIMAEECNISILEECVSLGTKRTIETSLSERQLSCDRIPQSPVRGQPEKTLDALLQASQMTVFRHVNNIINMLPMPHEVINFDAKSTPTEDQYREKMEELFTDSGWHSIVYHLSKAVLRYLTSLKQLPWRQEIPEESVKDIGRFATLYLEALHWLLEHGHYPSSDQLLTGIHCYTSVLLNEQLAAMMERREQTTLVCSAVQMVHSLLCSFLVLPGDSLVKLPDQENKEELPSGGFDDQHHAIRACDQISELVHSLTTHLLADSYCKVPQYLVNPLRRLIIVLARMPLVNSYARTPPLVWKIGTWMPSPSGDIRTKLPPLPLNFLEEKDILSDFIVRVNLLGWTSRQQFEETWMSLLGVLNPVSLGPEHPLSPEEIVDRTQCQILATRGITSLLLLSTLTPVSGNAGNSSYDHRPREKPLEFLSTRLGMRLVSVRSVVERELLGLMNPFEDAHPADTGATSVNQSNMLIGNIERELRDDGYRVAQFSVESLWSFVGLLDVSEAAKASESGTETESSSSVDSPRSAVAPPLTPLVRSPAAAAAATRPGVKQERSSRLSGLDIHSCLQFLLELYEAMLSPVANPRTPLVLLNETLRSVVILSDVFTDRAQFEWMLGMLLQVQKSHPAEDELVSHYVVLGVCKSAAVIGTTDTNVVEHIVKMIDVSLKSTHLPNKLAALYGSLYLLEAGLTDVARQIIPILSEYVLKSLGSITPMTIHSQQHVLVMWSLAFYIRENFLDEVKDSDFAARMFQLCISLVSVPQEPTPLSIYLAILRGLERLLLTKTLAQKDVDALIKLSIDRLCQPSPQRSFAALGLLLTCMYTGRISQQETTKQEGDRRGRKTLTTSREEEDDGEEEEEEATEQEQKQEQKEEEEEIIVLDTESLIIAMERVTVLFDRIRKGLPSEARIITNILPLFLMDFFPAQDMMNKVIGEFLYSQQPHPQLIAKVVFQVFSCLMASNQESLVKNWVMLSLSNFTQRTPLSMAIWIQTCFFISASTNHWLKAMFPHVIGRMGKLEVADERLFFISALDFHSQLTTDEGHLRTFQATFQSVAQTEPIYAELLCLCSSLAPSSSAPSSSAASSAPAASSQ